MIILAFPDYLSQARRLAAKLDAPLAEAALHHFPDGESLVRLPPSLPGHVVICRSLNQPNDKLVELLLSAATARELGAKRLTLVTPYLGYMRQDIANRPGEAVSQRIVGKLLGELFDDVLTVDPHLHRISSLNQAIPIKNAISLTAADQIGAFLKQQFKHGVLLGPDSESKQWVAAIAKNIGFDYAIAEKHRLGDKQVEMTLPDGDYRNKPVIIVDDMASTGRTMAKAAGLLQAKGCGDIYAVVTHALFCGDAYDHILNAGIKNIWSTDSIDHPSSCIKLDALLADALKAIT
ncbi:ribose-phosphate diphosphokinase [Candidatus Methylobacter oryzae]|uniref:Ribose-phosphate diphosphokinase n=1 Tax=Candidatus Methylobacter oryzae TaxID=2497749 RepID=A0ABY3CAP2_9GAMM|nr:ribose-phosphate diphosphokinase [Candidatus Methylobacter oryzae]TRW94621.1 ribose-phosphate diphosphokinase [Candidatus Methylobacter oryzae]